MPHVALRGPVGSDEFWIDYHKALNGADIRDASIGAGRTIPESVSAAIVGYYGSAEYNALATITRQTYRNTLERFRLSYGHF